jgi:hypothetical protein
MCNGDIHILETDITQGTREEQMMVLSGSWYWYIRALFLLHVFAPPPSNISPTDSNNTTATFIKLSLGYKMASASRNQSHNYEYSNSV